MFRTFSGRLFSLAWSTLSCTFRTEGTLFPTLSTAGWQKKVIHSNTWCCSASKEVSSASFDLTDLMKINSKSVSVLLRFLKGSLNFCTSTRRLATRGIVAASKPFSLIPLRQNKVGFSSLPQRMTLVSRLMLTFLFSIFPLPPILFSTLSPDTSYASGMCLRIKYDNKSPFFLGKLTGALMMIKKVCCSCGFSSNKTDFSMVRVYGFSMNQQLSKCSEFVAFSSVPLKGRSSSTNMEKICLLLCS